MGLITPDRSGDQSFGQSRGNDRSFMGPVCDALFRFRGAALFICSTVSTSLYRSHLGEHLSWKNGRGIFMPVSSPAAPTLAERVVA